MFSDKSVLCTYYDIRANCSSNMDIETKVEGESSQKKLPGGLIIEDIVVGSGLQAKSGQKVKP